MKSRSVEFARRELSALAALATVVARDMAGDIAEVSALAATALEEGGKLLFARQIRALGRPGDVLFLHSTSGNSVNLLRAAETARAGGLVTVGLLGRGGGLLSAAVDHAVIVPTDAGARAQELHLAIGHIVCQLVEERLNAD
ncbi:MAG: SIS domain-containing protein [Gemmatimonadota bacterium]